MSVSGCWLRFIGYPLPVRAPGARTGTHCYKASFRSQPAHENEELW